MHEGVSASSLRIGIVGAGSVVEQLHLPVLKTMSDVRVEWISDLDATRARRLGERFGVHQALGGLEECPDVDLALVAIPVGNRQKVIDLAIARRWHLFCEKPFARSRLDHEAITRAMQEAGLQVGAGFMRRFYRGVGCAREMLRARVLGEIRGVRAGEGLRLRATGREDGWYQTDPEAAGGGVLIETGSHLVDQVFDILGVEEYEVETCAQRGWRGLDYETRATARVSSRGTRCELGLVVSRLNDVFNGIEVQCANAGLIVGLTPDSPVTVCDTSGQVVDRINSVRHGVVTSYQAFHAEWRAFIEQCRTGRPSRVSAESALVTTAFVEACYRGARSVETGGGRRASGSGT